MIEKEEDTLSRYEITYNTLLRGEPKAPFFFLFRYDIIL